MNTALIREVEMPRTKVLFLIRAERLYRVAILSLSEARRSQQPLLGERINTVHFPYANAISTCL